MNTQREDDKIIEALKLSPTCPQCQAAGKTIRALLQALQQSRRIARRLRPAADDWALEIAKDRRRRAVTGGLVRQDKQPVDRFKAS